jgi:thioesterase domain-containing protein
VAEHWILGGDGGREAVTVPPLEWARWYQTADRTVARTKVGEAEVSTVFMGLDYQFDPDGPPLIFETMVFSSDPQLDEWTERYSTWSDAEAGHARIVEMVRAKSCAGQSG